jgi:WD40 repeat protein
MSIRVICVNCLCEFHVAAATDEAACPDCGTLCDVSQSVESIRPRKKPKPKSPKKARPVEPVQQQSSGWPWYVVLGACSLVAIPIVIVGVVISRNRPVEPGKSPIADTQNVPVAGQQPSIAAIPVAAPLPDDEMSALAAQLSNPSEKNEIRKSAAEKLAGQAERAKPHVKAYHIGMATEDLMLACAQGLRTSKDDSNETIKVLHAASRQVRNLKNGDARRRTDEEMKSVNVRRTYDSTGRMVSQSHDLDVLRKTMEERGWVQAGFRWDPISKEIQAALDAMRPTLEGDQKSSSALSECQKASHNEFGNTAVDPQTLLQIIRPHQPGVPPLIVYQVMSDTPAATEYRIGAARLLARSANFDQALPHLVVAILEAPGQGINPAIVESAKQLDAKNGGQPISAHIADSKIKHPPALKAELLSLSVDALLKTLDSDVSQGHRSAILLALGAAGTDAGPAIPSLVRLLATDDAMEQQLAVRGLALAVDRVSPELMAILLPILNKRELSMESQLGLCWLLLAKGDADKSALMPVLTDILKVATEAHAAEPVADVPNRNVLPRVRTTPETDDQRRFRKLRQTAQLLIDLPVRTTVEVPAFQHNHEIVGEAVPWGTTFGNVAVSANGKVIATKTEKLINVWNTEDWSRTARIVSQDNRHPVAVGNHGDYLVLSLNIPEGIYGYGRVEFWKLEEGRFAGTNPAVKGPAEIILNPNPGKSLNLPGTPFKVFNPGFVGILKVTKNDDVYTVTSGGTFHLWKHNAKPLKPGVPYASEYVPDKRLEYCNPTVIGPDDDTVLFMGQDKVLLSKLPTSNNPKWEFAEFPIAPWTSGPGTTYAVSADGQSMIVSINGFMERWDLASRTRVARVSQNVLKVVTYDPVNWLVAEPIAPSTFELISSLDLSADGNLIAACSVSGSVQIYDARSLVRLSVLTPGREAAVPKENSKDGLIYHGVKLCDDGKMVVAWGLDGRLDSLQVWRR